MQVKRNVKNLTAWVNPDEKKLWEEDKSKGGLGWSEWIKQKVRMAMKIDQLPVYDGEDLYELRTKLREKQETIKNLEAELSLQENKGMDTPPEDRLFRVLKENKSYMEVIDIYIAYTDFLMRESEYGDIVPILQRMTIKGITECDRTGNKWRLRSKNSKKNSHDKLREARERRETRERMDKNKELSEGGNKK